MARLWTCGFELNSIGWESTTVGGTTSTTVTSPVRSGTYALKVNIASSNYTEIDNLVSGGTSILYFRAYIYVTTYPSSNATLIGIGSTSGFMGGVYMNSSGQIGIDYSVSGTWTYGTTLSGVLSKSTWYCLELKVNTSTTNQQVVTCQLNGVQVDSQTGSGTSTSTTLQQVSWGAFINGSESGTATLYYDDLSINDSTGSSQNSWAGAGNVIRMTPNGAGDSNTWLTGAGGVAGASNNYTRIDEVTPDSASSYNLYRNPTTVPSDLYTVGGPTVPSGATVNCVQVGVVFRGASSSANSQFELQIEQASGGTISRSSAITPLNTSWNMNSTGSTEDYAFTLYTDPTGAAWTPSTIASMQIGVYGNSDNTNYAEISTVWAYVDYIPGAGGSTPTNLFFAAVRP